MWSSPEAAARWRLQVVAARCGRETSVARRIREALASQPGWEAAANEGALGFHVLIFESLEASDVVRFSGGRDQQCCIVLTPTAGAWS